MSEVRIIKKYPNRRLYDTAISSYVTLEDVKRLVIQEIPLQIIDARTQNDITHNTLLQIIIEQEEKGPSLFTTESLAKMIRFYGGSMQETLSSLFTQGVSFFTEQQAFLKENAKPENTSPTQDPLQFMADLTQKNLHHWNTLQQQWQNAFMSNVHKKQDPVHAEAESAQELNENPAT